LILFVAMNGIAQTNFLPGNKQCQKERHKAIFPFVQPTSSGQHYKRVTNNEIYKQDFENFTPGDMIFIDHDGLIPMDTVMFGPTSNWIVWEMEPGNHVAASTSYLANGNYTADDWMITPPITIDPGLAGPVYLVWDAKAFSPLYPDGYQVLVSTTDTALDQFTPIFQIAGENGFNWVTHTLNLTDLGYSGQIYLAFRNVTFFGWNLYIDNISVAEVKSYPDAALTSIATATFAAYGQEIHAAVTLRNNSSAPLTSAHINWTLNGSGPFTEDLTGLDIAFLSDTVFSFPIPKQMAGATIQLEGTNGLKVWVSDPNNMQDTINNNDTLSATFDLSKEYYYYMDFEHYVEGDMTLIDNDTLTPVNGWNDWKMANWNGEDNYAASTSYAAGGPVDQWMITPPIEVSNHAFAMWEGKAMYDGEDEVLEVLVSTTGNKIEDFTKLNTYHETTAAWTLRNCDLTAYSGQKIYLAFRGRSNNQTELGVDSIQIKPFIGIDLALTNIKVPGYFEKNTEINIKGSIKNTMATVVTSYKMSYQISNGDTITDAFTNDTIASLEAIDFTVPTSFSMSEIGAYIVKVWISEINGGSDDDSTNNVLSANVQAVPFIPERNLVIEEAAGTWCGWCVRGIVYMDSIYKAYPESMIPIAVHNSDPMENAVYNEGILTLVPGYPSLVIDRKYAIDPQDAFNNYNASISDFGFAILGIQADVDENRMLTADITATFAAALKGDFRFALVLTENNVHKDSAVGYDQANYYAGGGIPMGGFENLTDPVPAANMYYDYVAREILGGFTGEANSLPDVIAAGSTHEYTFSYTIPEEYNVKEMKAIVLLIDNQSGQILNAKATDFNFTGVSELSESRISVYPNPARNVIHISNIKSANIQLLNTMGQVILEENAGSNPIQINTGNYEPGIYFIKVNDEEKVRVIKVIVEK